MLFQFMKEKSHLGETFVTTVLSHVKICCITSERIGVFKCDICHYSCSLNSNMNKHVHEGEKPLGCDSCSLKSYRMSSNFVISEFVIPFQASIS